MSQFVIYGSGFGLYGYLPALVSCGQKILLPERYMSKFKARPELLSFIDKVNWVSNEFNLSSETIGAVIAVQPNTQDKLVSTYLLNSTLNYLILEKPLAHSPDAAAFLYKRLLSSGKVFRIGYTFRYMYWAKQLTEKLNKGANFNKLSISWGFFAHHFKHNVITWKRSHQEGGGILRFYGIHIVALLAELGYRNVVHSELLGYSCDEYELWRATFVGEGLPECDVFTDSRSISNHFTITQKPTSLGTELDGIELNLHDPFDMSRDISETSIDQRVPIIRQLCESLWDLKQADYDWYQASIQLWKDVETISVIKMIK